MAHHHYTRPDIENYTFDPKVKTFSFALIGIGLILFAIGVFTNLEFPSRIWATMMHNSYYFLGLGLAGMFYVAAQTIGYSGWVILVSRIHEAMARVVPIFAVIFGLVLVFGWHHIYHWSHEGIMDPASPNYDALLAGKQGFLNPTAFFVATAIYLSLWSLMTWLIRKNSYEHDNDPGFHRYVKAKKLCMIFLVIFAVSTSTGLWHWFMSIDPHWFSTLYGWYCFISIFVASVATSILIINHLKGRGHLQYITDEHLHDLGKWMFAFSVAWAYLWFSQFMLIWYANIPEETLYFNERFENYKILFFCNFLINFILPFLVLMKAGNKRRPRILIFVAIMVVVGHWLDFYLLAMPGSIKTMGLVDSHGHAVTNLGIGPLEIGFPMMMAGLFIFIVFSTLAKHSLVPINHPFLRESLEHQTNSI